MNVAGALARAVRNDGTPELELVARLLVEAATTQPALAIAGEQEGGDTGPSFDAVTGGVSVEAVASRLIAPRFVELVRAVALGDFITSGAAGIPWLTNDEVDEFLIDVPEREPGFNRSWLELAPVDDDGTWWVAYPQGVSTSIDFHLILPIAQGANFTRFVTLNPGPDVMTETTRAPQVVPGTGCDPGLTGLGGQLREACLSAHCSNRCEESWKVVRERKRLTGCRC